MLKEIIKKTKILKIFNYLEIFLGIIVYKVFV